MSLSQAGLTQLFVVDQAKHDICIPNIAWDPKSKYLATAGLNNIVHIYTRNGEIYFEFAVPSSSNGIISMEWDFLGENLAILQSNTSKLTMFHASSKNITYLDLGTVDSSHMAWSRKSLCLAISTVKGNVLLYNVTTNEKVVVQGKHSRRIIDGAWTNASDAHDWLALASMDRTLTVTDSTSQHVAQYGLKSDPIAVRFCRQKADGNDQGASMLCVNTGGRTLVLQALNPAVPPLELSFQEKYGPIRNFEWYGEGYVVVSFQNGYIASISSHISEIHDEIASLKLHPRTSHTLAYNHALQKVVSAGDDGIRVVSTLNWQQIPNEHISFPATHGEPVSLRFSPDEQILTVATSRGYVFNYLMYIPVVSSYNDRNNCIAYLSSLQQVTITNVASPSLSDKIRIQNSPNIAGAQPLLPSADSKAEPVEPIRFHKYLLNVAVEPTLVSIGTSHAIVGFNDHVWVYNLNLSSLSPHPITKAQQADPQSVVNIVRPTIVNTIGDMVVYDHPTSLLCAASIPASVIRVECTDTHIAILGGDGTLYVYSLLILAQSYKTALAASSNGRSGVNGGLSSVLTMGSGEGVFIPSELRKNVVSLECQSFTFPEQREAVDAVALVTGTVSNNNSSNNTNDNGGNGNGNAGSAGVSLDLAATGALTPPMGMGSSLSAASLSSTHTNSNTNSNTAAGANNNGTGVGSGITFDIEAAAIQVTDFNIHDNILSYCTTDGILTSLNLNTGKSFYSYRHTKLNKPLGITRCSWNCTRTRALFEDANGRWFVLNVVEDTVTRIANVPNTTMTTALWDQHPLFCDTLFYLHSNHTHQVYTYAYQTDGTHLYLHTYKDPITLLTITTDVLHNFAPHLCRAGVLVGPNSIGTLQFCITRAFRTCHALFNVDILRQSMGLSPQAPPNMCLATSADDNLLSQLVDTSVVLNAAAECLRLHRPREAWLLLRSLRVDMSLFDCAWSEYTHDGSLHYDRCVSEVWTGETKVSSNTTSAEAAWRAHQQYIEDTCTGNYTSALITALGQASSDGRIGGACIDQQTHSQGAAIALKHHRERNVLVFRMLLAIEYNALCVGDVDTAQLVAQQLGNFGACIAYEKIRNVEDPDLLFGYISMLSNDIPKAQQHFCTSSSPIEAVYMLVNTGMYRNAAQLLKTFFSKDHLLATIEQKYTLDMLIRGIGTHNHQTNSTSATTATSTTTATTAVTSAATGLGAGASADAGTMNFDPVTLLSENNRVAVMDLLADILYQAGEEAEMTKDINVAKSSFKECLEIHERLLTHYKAVAEAANLSSLPSTQVTLEKRTLAKQRSLFGLARTHIQENDTVSAMSVISKLDNKYMYEECAVLLETNKHITEAADVYVKAGAYDRAALLYLQSKNIPKARSIITHVNTPKVHILFAKAVEAAHDYTSAYASYAKCEDILAMTRLLIHNLNDIQRAFTIVRQYQHTASAAVLAEYSISQGNFGNAVEFLVLAKQMHRARDLALKYHKIPEYAQVIGISGTSEDYMTIAQYYISQNDYPQAGFYYRLAREFVLSVQCFLHDQSRDGIIQAIQTCQHAYDQQEPELSAMVSVVQEYIMHVCNGGGSGSGANAEDMQLLFKLYIAIKEYVQAAATAIIIADNEQNRGNYVSAHSLLHVAYVDLATHGITIPIELSRALLLLHSYLIVKRWVKLGQHHTAALLLARVSRSITKFPTHIVPILTSTIIECQRVGMKKTSSECAVLLTRPEHRSSIAEKYKRKIEALARRPEEEEVAEPCCPCPFCAFPLPVSSLDCPSCSNVIPWCIISGMHVQLADLSYCPSCRFPASHSLLVDVAKQQEPCPMCGVAVREEQVKRLGEVEASEWLKSGLPLIRKE